jgi:hypothetical protein
MKSVPRIVVRTHYARRASVQLSNGDDDVTKDDHPGVVYTFDFIDTAQ